MSQCARRRRASRVSSPPLPSPETCRSRSGYPGRPVFRRREFTLSRLFPPHLPMLSRFSCTAASRQIDGTPTCVGTTWHSSSYDSLETPEIGCWTPDVSGPLTPPTPANTAANRARESGFFRARSPLFVKETSFTFRSRDSDRRDRLVSCDADSDRLRRRFRAGSALFAAGAQVSLQVPTNKLYRSWYDGAYGYVSAEPIVSIDKVYCEAGENERVRERQSGKE